MDPLRPISPLTPELGPLRPDMDPLRSEMVLGPVMGISGLGWVFSGLRWDVIQP